MERTATTAMTGEALALALGDAERRVMRRLAAALAACDCTLERWRALALLSAHGGTPMTELAEHTQLPAASLTRLVDGMVADNLVHRKADERDRRRVLVHLTRRGEALRERLSERIAAEQQAIFGAAGEAELARLLEALLRFSDRLR